MAFAPGEIVQLKSGSPALTVIAIAGEEVEVVWYADEAGEFRTQKIAAIALETLDLSDFEDEDEEEEDDEDEDED